MSVGLVGLGFLGKAMARRLIAEGTELVVWNRTIEKAIGLGVKTAESPAALLARSDIVFLSLYDSEAVQAVLADPEGLLEGPIQGKIVVDTTTNNVDSVLRFHRLLEGKGATYLESPVLGSVPAAGQGELTALIGFDKDAITRVMPYLERLAKRMFFFEEKGLATKMKLVSSLVLGAFMATLAEALSLGETVGLPKSKVLDILAADAGNSAILNEKKEKLVREDFGAQFSSALMAKDLRYLESLLATLKKDLVTGKAVKELFDKAVAGGEGDLDFSAVYRVLKNA
jgi:3-hydroxyisobutyrate dehydrogenase